MPDLLIELFSEEIPARMQAKAREDLKRLMTEGLVAAGLTYASAGAFSTPRRLVLAIEGLDAASRPVREERKGPRTDAPPAALEGFLRSTGLTLDQLERRDEKKGQAFFAVIEKPGRPAAVIVAEVLEGTIRSFPWPKSMRWGAGSLRWVRPLHSILCLLTDEGGATVVPLSVDGIAAGATTEGHRFMAPGRFAVSGFDDYRAKLKRAFVMLDAAEREAQIWHDATTAAFALGLEVVPDAGLLTEVAGLVEWPVVLMGQIGEEYLALPPEVLQTSMREHQKFFSVRNPRTGRIERFVTVANRETADGGATVLAGNQKVLSARLSDARFFWENDLRTVQTVGMEGMAAGLANVTFHNKLGSQADRIARIEALAREIAPLVGASPDLAAEAARVAKADLQSAMVGEFPELQGTMGGYYARAAGLPEAVAAACKAHYQPLGPSDVVPPDPVSVAVALADKIDTLTGFWAIDEKPTGSKDPFALRRAALGVIRLVIENDVGIGLLQTLKQAEASLRTAQQRKERYAWWGRENEVIDIIAKFLDIDFEDAATKLDDVLMDVINAQGEAFVALETAGIPLENQGTIEAVNEHDLLAFLHDRLKVYLRDKGIRHDVIDACLAMPGNDDLTLLVKRAEALSVFLSTEDGANLLQGFKRANNILTQAEAKDGVEYSYGADVKFAEGPEERALFAALDTAEAALAPALAAEDFAAAMAALAALRAPVDAFFTAVQVNSDNAVIRRNRLNLLHRIRALCGQVVDLTRIEG
jgi:glycyl-tRNA synthetase beta chain